MEWAALIKLVVLLLSFWFEKDRAKKKQKREALKQVIEGIEEEDPSKITAGFDKVNR